ncbi:MAG: hypothetical protein M1284_02775 [Candidatus Parvarchaeota archaeon]|jgi:hypothetical protein|nr:hypothetical protein [Candidatus Parvarchaeota archaeon]MCL5420650.1 hypothetical protein [Candidatus Parvarchaeota archaeon]
MKSASENESRLEIFLSQSQFKKQVDSMGYNVFSLLLDMYEESKFDDEKKRFFPAEKKEEFSEISEELSERNSIYRGRLYRYLQDSDDYIVKLVFDSEYDNIMKKKNYLLEKFGKQGYLSIYNNFVNAQFDDSLMDAEGDGFFYINDRRFTPKNRDGELIWTFGKVIELLYSINVD